MTADLEVYQALPVQPVCLVSRVIAVSLSRELPVLRALWELEDQLVSLDPRGQPAGEDLTERTVTVV